MPIPEGKIPFSQFRFSFYIAWHVGTCPWKRIIGEVRGIFQPTGVKSSGFLHSSGMFYTINFFCIGIIARALVILYAWLMSRLVSSPSGWIEFTWNPLSSLERWLAVAGIIFLFLICELNTFYLKFVLWVPPENPLNFVRLGFILFWGAVGLRECFQLLDDPDCDRYNEKIESKPFLPGLIHTT